MATESQKKSIARYKERKWKRVPLDIDKTYFSDTLKPAADKAGEPVNTYIKKAIQARIDSGT